MIYSMIEQGVDKNLLEFFLLTACKQQVNTFAISIRVGFYKLEHLN